MTVKLLRRLEAMALAVVAGCCGLTAAKAHFDVDLSARRLRGAAETGSTYDGSISSGALGRANQRGLVPPLGQVPSIGFVTGLVGPAAAKVLIDVDLGAQRMHVAAPSGATYDWPISSGAPGHATPRGQFLPLRLIRMTHSWSWYDNEPMPFTIVFSGSYAIHGTRDVDDLGHPASHGCVRLAPDNAETLFDLVAHEGASIRIKGVPPPGPPPKFANHGGL